MTYFCICCMRWSIWYLGSSIFITKNVIIYFYYSLDKPCSKQPLSHSLWKKVFAGWKKYTTAGCGNYQVCFPHHFFFGVWTIFWETKCLPFARLLRRSPKPHPRLFLSHFPPKRVQLWAFTLFLLLKSVQFHLFWWNYSLITSNIITCQEGVIM